MQCLVTGASGYIGRALVRALVAERSAVRALVHRSPPSHNKPTSQNAPAQDACETVRIDLAQEIPSSTFDDVSVVFHLAGLAHSRATAAAYREINVDATARLAEQAAAAGVTRFVFLSSVKAAIADDPEACVAADNYARSKLNAERALMKISATTDMEIVVLRSALVYGSAAKGYLHLLERWVRMRLPSPPCGGRRSMIARDDLVQILLRLGQCSIDTPGNAPMALVATDGQCYSARRLHAALVAARHRGPWLPSPPSAAWRWGCHIVDLVSGQASGSSWARLQGEEVYTSSDFMALCGYAPRFNFEDVLTRDAQQW